MANENVKETCKRFIKMNKRIEIKKGVSRPTVPDPNRITEGVSRPTIPDKKPSSIKPRANNPTNKPKK